RDHPPRLLDARRHQNRTDRGRANAKQVNRPPAEFRRLPYAWAANIGAAMSEMKTQLSKCPMDFRCQATPAKQHPAHAEIPLDRSALGSIDCARRCLQLSAPRFGGRKLWLTRRA